MLDALGELAGIRERAAVHVFRLDQQRIAAARAEIRLCASERLARTRYGFAQPSRHQVFLGELPRREDRLRIVLAERFLGDPGRFAHVGDGALRIAFIAGDEAARLQCIHERADRGPAVVAQLGNRRVELALGQVVLALIGMDRRQLRPRLRGVDVALRQLACSEVERCLQSRARGVVLFQVRLRFTDDREQLHAALGLRGHFAIDAFLGEREQL